MATHARDSLQDLSVLNSSGRQETINHSWGTGQSPLGSPHHDHYRSAISPPATVDLQGRSAPLLVPRSSFARAIMGNEQPWGGNDVVPPPPLLSSTQQQQHCDNRERQQQQAPRASGLTVMMQQHEQLQLQREQKFAAATASAAVLYHQPVGLCEADSACGLPRNRPGLGSSAPSKPQTTTIPTINILNPKNVNVVMSAARGVAVPPPNPIHRNHSAGAVNPFSDRARRCISSKELGTLAPPSGSPYARMLVQKEQLEESTRKRLQEIKSSVAGHEPQSDESTSTSSQRAHREARNESRQRRRTLHNKAIVDELVQLVADLFISESKLLTPTQYGVSEDPSVHSRKDHVVKIVHDFVSALPMRYALAAETPSEVLLHMRLMAAVRGDRTKAVVHIHNLDNEHNEWSRAVASAPPSNQGKRLLRLVTISCRDAQGLLERITKALASGGSTVLDADVMLSRDGIVLDRFVVEMSGRLRLNKLAQLIEDFLKERANGGSFSCSSNMEQQGEMTSPAGGPLYYNEAAEAVKARTHEDICLEMKTAVPLTHVLANAENSGDLRVPELPLLRRLHSMPTPSPQSELNAPPPGFPLPMRNVQDSGIVFFHQPAQEEDKQQTEHADLAVPSKEKPFVDSLMVEPTPNQKRRPLVNRRAAPDLGVFESSSRHELQPLDYVTVPSTPKFGPESRAVPLIPFDELMLIETLGTGRVSTIYRAAWQRPSPFESHLARVHMVALKVAMVNGQTGDTSHVDELRREADIAARLEHPNICDLVGVAADAECFCLAYDFCEGGSLLELLSDTRRYYEYLPIALDVANGMAYLHSRDVIHRDLKPSNILLTKDRRAKIADFGMSVAYFVGQELTAETGTYRYMAPEVIRHESYSSNADVYSFGLVLWQLISRQIPFATMTPIQAAYAVAEGKRPPIPPSTPRRLQEIIEACWDQDSYRRPSFTYIVMALADYAKMAFSPANVGAQTLQIANEMLAHVNGNSTVNVDMTAPVTTYSPPPRAGYVDVFYGRSDSMSSDVGLAIE